MPDNTDKLLLAAQCDPEYAEALRTAGVTSVTLKNGKTLTHDDIAKATLIACERQRANFPLKCGCTWREQKQRNRAYKSAVRGDVSVQTGIVIPDNAILVGLGLLLAFFGGPVALAVAVISTIFEWYLTKKLDGTDEERSAAITQLCP